MGRRQIVRSHAGIVRRLFYVVLDRLEDFLFFTDRTNFVHLFISVYDFFRSPHAHFKIALGRIVLHIWLSVLLYNSFLLFAKHRLIMFDYIFRWLSLEYILIGLCYPLLASTGLVELERGEIRRHFTHDSARDEAILHPILSEVQILCYWEHLRGGVILRELFLKLTFPCFGSVGRLVKGGGLCGCGRGLALCCLILHFFAGLTVLMLGLNVDVEAFFEVFGLLRLRINLLIPRLSLFPSSYLPLSHFTN